jgi:hypothetical protein
MSATRLVRRLARRFGVDVVRYRQMPMDFTQADRDLVEFVRPYTMTSSESIVGLANATRWLTAAGVSGDIVECGVWRGGSIMAVAKTLLDAGVPDRDLHLFDTFTGMPRRRPRTATTGGRPASTQFAERADGDQSSHWCRAGIRTVRANLALTGYPPERLHVDPVPAVAHADPGQRHAG